MNPLYAAIAQAITSLSRMEDTRKFFLCMVFESYATLLAYCKVLSGEHWVAVTMGLAGLFVAGNVMEHKSKGAKSDERPSDQGI
jgi:hypothetical protein